MIENHRRAMMEREMEIMAEHARFFETMEAQKEFASKIDRMKKMLDKRQALQMAKIHEEKKPNSSR